MVESMWISCRLMCSLGMTHQAVNLMCSLEETSDAAVLSLRVDKPEISCRRGLVESTQQFLWHAKGTDFGRTGHSPSLRAGLRAPQLTVPKLAPSLL